ncbi:MAG: heavy metal-responsive transcriptional regulator [Nitriliruptorales bacterium]
MLIGDVAAATGVTSKTLRYYESEGLLHQPVRTRAGYRDYSPDILDRVRFIRQAQASGLTLRQIGQILAIRDDGQAPCHHVAQLVDDRLDAIEEQLRQLRRTRAHLRQLRGHLDRLDPAECDSRSVCSAIRHT